MFVFDTRGSHFYTLTNRLQGNVDMMNVGVFCRTRIKQRPVSVIVYLVPAWYHKLIQAKQANRRDFNQSRSGVIQ